MRGAIRERASCCADAFALSAAFTGVAGGLFAALFAFVAPDSFPFSQSILFLLAVIVGGAGWTLWQHSSTGSVPGIAGKVDLDRFNGSSLQASLFVP